MVFAGSSLPLGPDWQIRAAAGLVSPTGAEGIRREQRESDGSRGR